MKSFLKFTLASIVGFLIAGLIVFFTFFIILSTALSTAEKEITVKPNSILHLELDQPIPDRTPGNPMKHFDFNTFKPSPIIGLNDILANLDKAMQDDKIKGVFLDMEFVQAGFATVEEIRDKLKQVKDSGKFIVAYGDFLTQNTYYLASVADEIYLNPAGLLELKGLRSQEIFIKGTMEKLGLEPQVIRHGEYKSFVETYTRQDMSPENKEQRMAYISSIWDYTIKNISKERNVNTNLLNDITDRLATIENPANAVDNNIIDKLLYRDQVIDRLQELAGTSKKPPFVSIMKYNHVPKKREYRGLARDKIAVIYAGGEIMPGENDDDQIASDKLSRSIRSAREDSSIKAVVFRINSPGGSALASEVIWREIRLTKKVKPVIASIGNLGASGGYYIASPADTILVSPNSITGSIGIFGIFLTGKEFMNDKLGITSDLVKTNQSSDVGNFFRPITGAERMVFKKHMDNFYKEFVARVAEDRGMTYEEVDKIARGRVWSGKDAVEIGLADQYGGLEKAIKIAKDVTGLTKYRIVNLPKAKDPFTEFLKQVSGSAKTRILKSELGGHYPHYLQVKKALKWEGIQARLPFNTTLND